MNALSPKVLLIRNGSGQTIKLLRYSKKSSLLRPNSSRWQTGLVALFFISAGAVFLPMATYALQTSFKASPTINENLNAKTTALPGEPNALPMLISAPANKTPTSGRLIIQKINVDMPIVGGTNEKALLLGAWQYPYGGNPESGGNTVIFGHRYLRLPPSHQTFFSLDKLNPGDTITIVRNGKTFTYAARDSKVVPPTDVSVLNATKKPILTLVTCAPLFSSKNRLVVTADLVSIN